MLVDYVEGEHHRPMGNPCDWRADTAGTRPPCFDHGEEPVLEAARNRGLPRAVLAEAGFGDGDGFVETPSGGPLDLVIHMAPRDLSTGIVEPLTTKYLPSIGVEATTNVADRTTARGLQDVATFGVHVRDDEVASSPLAQDFDAPAPGGPNMSPCRPNATTDPADAEFVRPGGR